MQRSGCQWEMLPHDFPPHETVYKYFQKWRRQGIWQDIHDRLRHQLRREMGREEEKLSELRAQFWEALAGLVSSLSAKGLSQPTIHGLPPLPFHADDPIKTHH